VAGHNYLSFDSSNHDGKIKCDNKKVIIGRAYSVGRFAVILSPVSDPDFICIRYRVCTDQLSMWMRNSLAHGPSMDPGRL
jgi:hypothetical protein